MSTTEKPGSIPSTAVEAAPGLWRTNLQHYDLSIPRREMIQARVDIEPDSPPVRHFHPGEEIIYVLQGSLEYSIDGQPTKVYNAGEALTVPAGWSTRCATSAAATQPSWLLTSWRRASRSSR